MEPANVAQNMGRRRRMWAPAPSLRPYVACFELLEQDLGATQILNPLPARNGCFLQFHLKQPYRVLTVASKTMHLCPTRTLVGPHTRRTEDLLWTGALKVFTIRFSSIGFRSIFGIPLHAIRNVATSAELVLGPALPGLEERLHQAPDDRLPAIASDFLLDRLDRQRVRTGGALVLAMTAAIKSPRRAARLNELAAAHNLGLRQIERLFRDFVGVSPKSFERLHRTNRALALKRSHPGWDWAAVAAECGYFDQSHLIREFRDHNRTTPEAFDAAGRAAHRFRAQSPDNSGHPPV